MQRGFTPLMTPDVVREAVFEKCGFQPRGANTQVRQGRGAGDQSQFLGSALWAWRSVLLGMDRWHGSLTVWGGKFRQFAFVSAIHQGPSHNLAMPHGETAFPCDITMPPPEPPIFI